MPSLALSHIRALCEHSSIVDRTRLEPGCQVMLIKVHAIVGVLDDDEDPLVHVMSLKKGSIKETYADIGGLEEQIMEIKRVLSFH